MVEEDNRPAWEVFEFCSTQWRYLAGMGGVTPTGLDYAAVAAVMGLLGVADARDCLDRVRLLEGAALDEMGTK